MTIGARRAAASKLVAASLLASVLLAGCASSVAPSSHLGGVDRNVAPLDAGTRAGAAWGAGRSAAATLPSRELSLASAEASGFASLEDLPEYARRDARLSVAGDSTLLATRQWPSEPRTTLARSRVIFQSSTPGFVNFFERERWERWDGRGDVWFRDR